MAPYAYKKLSRPLSALDFETPGKWLGGWAVLIALWLFVDILGALAGGRFYPHYFLAISASLPVMVGISYWHFVEHPASHSEGRNPLILFTTCAILSSAVLTQFLDIDTLRRAGEKHPQYLDIDRLRDARSIIEHLKKNKEEGSTLFTWDYTPLIYFETGLISPYKLTSTVNLKDSHYMRKSHTDSLLSTLENESPTYIVDRDKAISRGALAPIHKRFRNLLDRNYEFVKADGEMRLYKKRSSSSKPEE